MDNKSAKHLRYERIARGEECPECGNGSECRIQWNGDRYRRGEMPAYLCLECGGQWEASYWADKIRRLQEVS